MNKKINPDETLYQILEKNPHLEDVLYSLGFAGVKNPAMRATHAKIMTLRKGCGHLGISFEKVKEEFLKAGFDIEF